MSELPVLPLWVTKFEGKTAHLSLEEDGAYNRLMRLCWRTPTCTIPSDPQWITRQMRVDDATYARVVKPILDEFFQIEGGRWHSSRLLAEYESALAKTRRRQMAGAKGGKAKSLKKQQMRSSNATAMPEQCSSKPYPYPEPQREEAKASSTKRSSRLPADWSLPDDWREWARAFVLPDGRSLASGMVEVEASKFADYWHARPGNAGAKADWLATWRNWIRSACERQRIPAQGRNWGGSNDLFDPGAAPQLEVVIIDGKPVTRRIQKPRAA